MKKVIFVLFVGILVLSWSSQCWAPSYSATATLSATVPTSFSIALGTDSGTAATDPTVVTFTTMETYGDGFYMQAPASSTGKSWHSVNVSSNLSSWTLGMDVTTLPSGITDKTRFKVGFSGGYDAGAPLGSPAVIAQWPVISFWRAFPNSDITTTFRGQVKCYMSYQLYSKGLAPSTYSGGRITYTITGS